MSVLGKDGKNKCEICVGCGRCESTAEGLHIITESFLKPELLPAGETAGKGSFVVADIGTTTIAMELYDSMGTKQAEYVAVNPQRVVGADVISRIQAAENPMMAKQLQAFVLLELENGIEKFLTQIGEEEAAGTTKWQNVQTNIQQAPCIEKIYIAGNTVMLNILCGHDVQPLGYAPFRADFLEQEILEIKDIPAVTMPGLSAFVGGDVVAGILATGMQRREEISLLIDLGTNGELVLGNREKLLAGSTAAGPAFEGMLRSQGKSVWGADIVVCVAELLKRGIVDETGLLAEPYFETGVTMGGVCITQDNIRSLQMAKAAIATGVQTLVKEYGLKSTKEIQKVYLAGGFGYYLKEWAAMDIGLLPEELMGKIQAVGNSALAGCYYRHICALATQELEQIRTVTKVVNLAEMEVFTEEFVANMNLKKLV